MAFTKKTWKDRLVEFAGRRSLKRISGDPNGTMIVDVTRNEGTVSQEGDVFSAANMNDLEQRIADGFAQLNSDIQKLMEKVFPNTVYLYKDGVIGAYGIRESIYKTQSTTGITFNDTNIKMSIYWLTGVEGDGALISTSAPSNYSQYSTVRLKAKTDGICSMYIAYCPTLPTARASSYPPNDVTMIQQFNEMKSIDAEIAFSFPSSAGYIAVGIIGGKVNSSVTASITELSVL